MTISYESVRFLFDCVVWAGSVDVVFSFFYRGAFVRGLTEWGTYMI